MRIWLQITCGRGPRECAYAVPRVLKVLLEEAAAAGLAADVIESVPGRYDGTLYSALVALDGVGADTFCARWNGPVCWVARSPFRPNHKRKNWFLSVETFSPPNPNNSSWKENELRFDTMRASGPGGQHVNKTESAVRVTHDPTGLSATAREERSQLANRKLALARLAELFRVRETKALAQLDKTRWSQHNDLERGNALRTFVGEKFEEQ